MTLRSRLQPPVQAGLTLENRLMRSIPFLPTLLGFTLLLAVTAGGVEGQTGLKIGYINSQAIYEEAPGAQEAQTQFEREMMLERQREGIAKAQREGKYRGRAPTAMRKRDEVLAKLAEGVSKRQIAKELGISERSVYRAASL